MKVKYLYLVGAVMGFASLAFAIHPLNPFFLFGLVVPFLTLKKFVDFIPEEALQEMRDEEMKAFQRGIEFGVRTEEGIAIALAIGALLLMKYDLTNFLFLMLLVANMGFSALAAEITLEKSERIEANRKGRKIETGGYKLRDFLSVLAHLPNPRRVFVVSWYMIDCLFFRKARSRLEPYFKL